MKVVVWLLIALVLVGITYSFSTCRAEQSGRWVELTLFDWNWASYTKMNHRRIAVFEAENQDIRVRLVTGGEDKYLTMVTGNVAPDVTIGGHTAIPYYAKRKAILALDEFIADDKDFSLDDYFGCAVDSVRYRGGIYALPDNGSPVALFYNKDLFDEYNNNHPDQQLTYPSEKWTWADFRHAAKALTQDRDGDGQTDVYGTLLGFYRNRFPIPVWQNGGEVISADKKRCLMDTPEAIAGIRWLYEMMWVDKSAPTARTQIEGASQQSGMAYFREQHVAMLLTARYAYNELLGRTNFVWDIAPYPRGPVNRTSLYLSGVWMISSQTRHPQKAWRLAKFLVGEESSEMSMRCGRALAANRAVAKRLLRHPGEPPAHDYIWIDIMENSRPKDCEFKGMGHYFDRAMNEIQSYIPEGRRTPEEACRNFTRIYQKGLDRLWKEEGGP